ncbi:MAG: tetratricopeptide repeat protein [Candidatus Methylomirabilales bacterium]
MWFKTEKSYNRSVVLEAADRARAKGKSKKAIVQYRRVLEANPHDHVIHGKIAPLLAETKQLRDAWLSFVAAGEGYVRNGFVDQAISMYRQAARYFPREVEVWEAIARLQVDRERQADAVKALLEARRHFRGRHGRLEAIRLLHKACEIEPGNFEVTYELARLLGKTGDKEQARRMLNGLADEVRGRNLRSVRGALFRMSPNPVTAWQWLWAAIAQIFGSR